MGGGTLSMSSMGMSMAGLSPRGRGNLFRESPYIASPGSIPAWAGEPFSRCSGRWPVRVYPRVGGGTLPPILSFPSIIGLSPRGRGNLNFPNLVIPIDRSIPAWAGEPGRARESFPMEWVYPRVGGGTALMALTSFRSLGLSPRGRGNPWWS